MKKGMFAYPALQNGVPVSCAAAMAVDECLYVLAVATLPEAQRCGYGEAATRKALYEGAKATGLKRATLHATAAGAPVYERIGFRKVAKMSYFALKPH